MGWWEDIVNWISTLELEQGLRWQPLLLMLASPLQSTTLSVVKLGGGGIIILQSYFDNSNVATMIEVAVHATLSVGEAWMGGGVNIALQLDFDVGAWTCASFSFAVHTHLSVGEAWRGGGMP